MGAWEFRIHFTASSAEVAENWVADLIASYGTPIRGDLHYDDPISGERRCWASPAMNRAQLEAHRNLPKDT